MILFGEPVQLVFQGLELEHEQLDSRIVEGRDTFGHLLVAADETGKGTAVGPDPAGAREHLVHLGLRVGAAGDLGPALGVDQRLQMRGLGGRLGVGLAGDHEGGQAESQRRAVRGDVRAGPRSPRPCRPAVGR